MVSERSVPVRSLLTVLGLFRWHSRSAPTQQKGVFEEQSYGERWFDIKSYCVCVGGWGLGALSGWEPRGMTVTGRVNLSLLGLGFFEQRTQNLAPGE